MVEENAKSMGVYMKPAHPYPIRLLVLALLLFVFVGRAQEPLTQPVLEHPVQDEILYFVIPDRFYDAVPENNCGDFEGECIENAPEAEVLEHGYLPSDKGYYHGGDLQGIIEKLDYLTGLGVTAIWVGPIFHNKPVQPDSSNLYGHSSGYHGYWITDFLEVDPHLGTNEDFRELVDAAHERGIKVFMDIITNHTADVIQYADGDYGYRTKEEFPYLTADGEPFDDAAYAYDGQGEYEFPELDLESFPYLPVIPEGEAKNPDWLNNPLLYHNRGNTTFSGENSLYGDFFGLDDLFTERREVVEGMIDIYSYWIEEFGVDGFRIDTTKHVNLEFWQAFGPAILEAAQDAGIEGFFAFGEVYDQLYGPAFTSEFTTDGELQATIDFGFQVAARDFASRGNPTDNLATFFEGDDYYTDEDSNVYAMPTFLGNHDMGRIGYFLREDQPDADNDELLARSKLAHALMFFARGQPVIYYGDEQGFIGDGGDKDARQDMFASQVEVYNDDPLLGTDATTAEENFDPTHPLYRALAEYAEVYHEHEALRRGAQIHRYSTDEVGIYAFSRVDRDDGTEYIVALNNATEEAAALVPTYAAEGATFELVYGPEGAEETLTADAAGALELSLPALDFVIYRAAEASAQSEAPEVVLASPEAGEEVALAVNSWDGHEVLERLEVRAEVEGSAFTTVTFAVDEGNGEYRPIGTDDNPPYRVFFDGLAESTPVSFKATAEALGGGTATAEVSSITAVVEAPAPPSTEYPYAVIHYARPEGDYGTLEGGDAWGVHTWGEAIEAGQGENVWEEPLPFVGEDDFGRFVPIKLADGSLPLNFIIHTPSGDEVPETREPGGDRSFIPNETPEVWVVQGDETIYTNQAEAQGYVTVHYRNETGDYADTTLEVSQGEVSMSGLEPDTNDYGAVFTVPLDEGLNPDEPLNSVVNRGGEGVLEATFTPTETASVWLEQGDETVYTSRSAAEGMVTLHYRRDDADYGNYDSEDFADFWGLHVWTGAENPTEWQDPIRAAGADPYGVVFEVPLEEGATELAYIIHRGDEKDPGPDQILDMETYGYEVWQPSGADPEQPYLLPPDRAERAD